MQKLQLLATFLSLALIVQGATSLKTEPCHGQYYTQLNGLFVECLYNDVPYTYLEKFYQFHLAFECSTIKLADLQTELQASSMIWRVPENISNDVVLNQCDFYENGMGYQFTVIDQGFDAVILDGRREGAKNDEYKNKPLYVPMLWNWNELKDLIDTYCKQQSGQQQASGTQGQGGQGVQGGQQAASSSSRGNQQAASSSAPANQQAASSSSVQPQQNQASSSSVSGQQQQQQQQQQQTSPNTSTSTSTSTQTGTGEQSQQQQQQQQQTQGQAAQGQAANQNIPAGMEDIVKWITQQVQQEQIMACNNCSLQQAPAQGAQGGGEQQQQNQQQMQQQAATFFDISNYTIPPNCTLQQDSKSILCEEQTETDHNKVLITFDQMNNYKANIESQLCTKLPEFVQLCNSQQQPGCLTDQCEEFFKTDKHEAIYEWLHFDVATEMLIQTDCQALDPTFALDITSINPCFSGTFGDLTVQQQGQQQQQQGANGQQQQQQQQQQTPPAGGG